MKIIEMKGLFVFAMLLFMFSCKHKLKEGEVYPIIQNGELVVVNNSDRDQEYVNVFRFSLEDESRSMFNSGSKLEAHSEINTNLPIDSLKSFFMLIVSDEKDDILYRLEQDNMKLDSFTIEEMVQIQTLERDQ